MDTREARSRKRSELPSAFIETAIGIGIATTAAMIAYQEFRRADDARSKFRGGRINRTPGEGGNDIIWIKLRYRPALGVGAGDLVAIAMDDSDVEVGITAKVGDNPVFSVMESQGPWTPQADRWNTAVVWFRRKGSLRGVYVRIETTDAVTGEELDWIHYRL